ncbi:glutamate--cysteine ligase [Aquisalinus flavus]|uniref:Glutamate--cysteine ligase n=1 Tax=Aquisalinus flavus TaxID=1526572 RepID=A0A8J2Y4Q1_9PROT|nr:glutamate--cysteine ligase [Aquisalinus flavus]MBD0427246.1 glutamate--cysteine ligase [Aquisalinus flavus]UNE47060.1 glutamate--cysteine ligase [Aquisalinus flavus]GGC99478.1 glutamate--cysteine ligase [Aquisalinus flavus]
MTQLDASTRQDAPPIEGKDDLIAHLESGCKPKADWRIGTEHEKFGFTWDDLKPIPFEGKRSISAILNGLAEQFNWEPIHEGDRLLGLKQDGASISLEPGGQFELSGAPLEHVHQTCSEVGSHLEQVRKVSEPLGIGFLGMGFTPNWTRDEMPRMPKGRYTIMRNYMPKVGTLGLDMMHRTSTVQVNLDYASEADMVAKFRTSLALQPLANALFASSPLTEGKPNGWRSYRGHIWTDTDPNRTGMLDFVFEDGFDFERYVDYMLGVPMYFHYGKNGYEDAAGLSFRDFMAGQLPIAPGVYPSIEDWKDHLSTAFPEVRLKTFLEMRGADGGPWARICALPAFWVGILYEGGSLDAAWDVVKGWTVEQRHELRVDAAKKGLEAKIGKHRLRDIAREVLTISRQGLKDRAATDLGGNDETGFLGPLQEIVESGKTLADVILEDYTGPLDRDMRKLYEKYAY